MPGDEAFDTAYPAPLRIRFAEIEAMDVRALGDFFDGLSDALERVNQVLAPHYPLEFRAKITVGSMDIELFAQKRKTAWDRFRDASANEGRVAPVKVVTGLVLAGLLAGMAYVASPVPFSKDYLPDPNQHPIGRHHIYGPADLPDIAHLLAHDPRFCKSIGKAFKAVWDDERILTMLVYQVPDRPPVVFSRDQIASAHLECRSRRRR